MSSKEQHSNGDMSGDCVEEIEQDDIYGDLESSIFAVGSREANQSKNDLEEKLMQAAREMHVLQNENRKLLKENKNYATNVSSLYNTAKTEIEKKNFIIRQLQSKLKEVTTFAIKSKLGKKEFEEIFKNCQEAQQEANSQVTVDEIIKSIHQLTSEAKSTSTGYKKQYIFGNMSLYLFREQVPFDKEGHVVQMEGSNNRDPVSRQQPANEHVTSCNSSQVPHSSENNTLQNPENRRNSRDGDRHVTTTSKNNVPPTGEGANLEKLHSIKPLLNSENENKRKNERMCKSPSKPNSRSPPRNYASRGEEGRLRRPRENENDKRHRPKPREDYNRERGKNDWDKNTTNSNKRRSNGDFDETYRSKRRNNR